MYQTKIFLLERFITQTVYTVRTRINYKTVPVTSLNKYLHYGTSKGTGKVLRLHAWSGPEVSRKLRFPDFMTTAQDGGKVVSLTHRPPLPPGNVPGTHFC